MPEDELGPGEPGPGGESVMLGVRGRPGTPSAASRSAEATPASVVSNPFAVPARAPANGTVSMGAFFRFAYPDLMRLFEVDSLERDVPRQGQFGRSGK
jgi:hypothetical protein